MNIYIKCDANPTYSVITVYRSPLLQTDICHKQISFCTDGLQVSSLVRSDNSTCTMVNVCTNILGSLPERIRSLQRLNSKQEFCWLYEFQTWKLLCIQNMANSVIWPGLGKKSCFPLTCSAFSSNHHNNIHYSPSAYCLVNSFKGANAQLEALLCCQSFTTWRFALLYCTSFIMY